MLFSTHQIDGITVVQLPGPNFDATVARSFSEQFVPALRQGESLVLDCASIDFADSAGLGVLCKLARMAPSGFVLAAVGPQLTACLARIPSAHVPAIITSVSSAVTTMGNGKSVASFKMHRPVRGLGKSGLLRTVIA